MKSIPIKHGYYALVDDEDFDRVSALKWRPCIVRRKDGSVLSVYAFKNAPRAGSARRGRIDMHRFILGLSPSDPAVDHINHDGLDNRKCNLRTVTDAQNAHNRRKTIGTSSSFKGVTWNRRVGKWQAQIRTGDKCTYLGLFTEEQRAARAYADAARERFGDFAWTEAL